MLCLRRAPLVRNCLRSSTTTLLIRRDFAQSSFLQRVFMNVPKGFEKFYRNANSKSDSKQQSNNQKDGKKDNSGGNKNKKPDENTDMILKLASIGALILFLMVGFEDPKSGR